MLNNVFFAEIDIICIVVTSIILLTYKGIGQHKMQATIFRRVLKFLIVYCSASLAMQMLNPPSQSVLDNVLSILKIIATTCICFNWFLFIFYKSESNSYFIRKWGALITAPLAFSSLYAIFAIVLNPYDIDVTTDPTLCILLSTTYIGYIVAANSIAHERAKICHNRIHRKEYHYLSAITFVPLTGIALQAIFPEYSIIEPILTITLLHIYLMSLFKQITIDSETGINNTPSLAIYLDNITGKPSSGKRIFYIQIKLDHMDYITKTYGSAKTSSIVIKMANFLKQEIQGKNIFLARSDKYQFSLVTECRELTEIETICNEIIQNSESSDIQHIVPPKVSFSVYWSEYDSEKKTTIDNLLEGTSENCIKAAVK